jgi:hypothetical protein
MLPHWPSGCVHGPDTASELRKTPAKNLFLHSFPLIKIQHQKKDKPLPQEEEVEESRGLNDSVCVRFNLPRSFF